jgi:hypothetical protein
VEPHLHLLLIAHGGDVKTVQARLRHGSAKTTFDTYGHLWPDKDESTKAVIDALVDSKFRDLADSVRTEGVHHDAPPAQRPRKGYTS